jgi:hypothetical protein
MGVVVDPDPPEKSKSTRMSTPAAPSPLTSQAQLCVVRPQRTKQGLTRHMEATGTDHCGTTAYGQTSTVLTGPCICPSTKCKFGFV